MNPYKNINGVWLLRGLFLETSDNRETVKYTLKAEDHSGYASLYLAFLSSPDPTEYQFSRTYLGGWEHWQAISQSKWFSPYATQWRQEYHTRYISNLISSLHTLATAGGKEAYSANRYLLERAEKLGGASKRGRPSRVALIDDLTVQGLEAQEMLSDYKRVLS